jgi:hypothetical protein
VILLLDFILLFLFAGLPYYLIAERITMLKGEKLFFLSIALMLGGVCLASSFPQEHASVVILIALLSAMFSLYKATQTTNFYKLAYYLVFVNAPIFLVFDVAQTGLYALSLVLSLLGVYGIGKHYERHYGSANYHSITGITLMTPYAGLFLTVYLITLALYPPFPNALIFLYTIIEADVTLLWLVTVVFIFFANFILAMRVMAKTVFGKANSNIHYVELSSKEKIMHLCIIILLGLLSIWGLKEVLV